MKKYVLSLLFIPFVIPSCNKNLTDMPKSPFNDSYIRIGMKGEYNESLTPLEASNYAALKSAINNYNDEDKAATKVVRNEETRDLKYAYFGSEVGLVSRCSMLSRTDIESRYTNNGDNYITTKEAISNQQNQTANAGIIKTDSKTVDYVYDDNYLHGTTLKSKYGVRTSVKNNDEPEVVTQTTPLAAYVSSKFDLQPYTADIKENFKPSIVREKEYDFDILRDTNSAVYGKCIIDGKEKYLIKEGYSLFSPYTTTVGRTYKAVDNYFYEGLLEEFTNPSNNEGNDFRFTNFRFYHEVLILSKAYDEGVPVLYLEKPVVVWYDEIKYEISYDSLGEYKGTIPEPTVE